MHRVEELPHLIHLLSRLANDEPGMTSLLSKVRRIAAQYVGLENAELTEEGAALLRLSGDRKNPRDLTQQSAFDLIWVCSYALEKKDFSSSIQQKIIALYPMLDEQKAGWRGYVRLQSAKASEPRNRLIAEIVEDLVRLNPDARAKELWPKLYGELDTRGCDPTEEEAAGDLKKNAYSYFLDSKLKTITMGAFENLISKARKKSH
jgi:hypothetical protein